MKFTTNTNQLTNAVAIAVQYMPKESEFEGKIVLVGKNGKITVKTTDYIQTVLLKQIEFVSEDITVDEFTEFSIDGKKLLTALKSAKTEEIIMEINSNFLLIKSGRSKLKIEIVHEVQIISTTSSENYLNIDSNIIADFKKIFHAIDSGNPKPSLNGALVQIKDGNLFIVSSDTKRLSVCSCATEDKDIDMIVPKEAISSMVKLFNDNVIAEYDDVSLTIKTQNITYSTRLINDKFPDWNRIVPNEYKSTLVIARAKLAELIKETSLFDMQITIAISDGKIVISDKDNTAEVEDTVEDESVKINFTVNAKSVLDFLTSYDGENVEICFNEKNLPITLKANGNYQEVCMPIVIKEGEKAA